MDAKPDDRRQRLLLIDQQDSWRERAATALQHAGYAVQSLDTYQYPPAQRRPATYPPDLVVLGCASIGPEEQALIARVLHEKHHLLVLSTSLPWHIMRALFLEGANDVTDKPYDSDLLVETITQALRSIAHG